MPRVEVPGQARGLTDLGTEAVETVRDLRTKAGDVLSAAAVGQIMRALSPNPVESTESSLSTKGIGDLLGSVTSSFKNLTDLQASLLKGQLERASGNGGDSSLLMTILLISMMNQGKNDSSDMWLHMMNLRDKNWQERYDDLAQRAGPSPNDQLAQQAMYQMFGAQIERVMQPPQNALESLASQIEQVKKLRGVFGVEDGNSEYSEGALRHKELAIEERKIIEGNSLERDKINNTKELINAVKTGGPQMVSALVGGVAQVLGAFGVGGVTMVPPADAAAQAEAEAAMAQA